MLTWLPANQQVATPVVVPAYFVAGAPGLTRADVVETYPRSTGVWVGGARPMLWQVASGFAYRTTGGYFIGSDATARPAGRSAGHGLPAARRRRRRGRPAAVPPTRRRAARDELRALGVSAVVVVPEGADVAAVLDWTRRVARLPGEQVDDVWLFRLAVGRRRSPYPGQGDAPLARDPDLDADRERAAARLQQALAEGRITLDELEERLAVVYAARYAADLLPVRGSPRHRRGAGAARRTGPVTAAPPISR